MAFSVRLPDREDCPELEKRFISNCIIVPLSSEDFRVFSFLFSFTLGENICPLNIIQQPHVSVTGLWVSYNESIMASPMYAMYACLKMH